MEIIFSEKAQNDLEYWKKINNEKIQRRITELLKSILQMPFSGIGKPEPLRHNLSGKWSRRINDEHRIVYSVETNFIKIHSLKGHY
jgi:toxin YoeB